MVIGDVTGTVQKSETTSRRSGRESEAPSDHTGRGGTDRRSAREREQRIAELEAENRRLARELARRDEKRQAMIDQYERALAARSDPTPDREDTGILACVRRLLR